MFKKNATLAILAIAAPIMAIVIAVAQIFVYSRYYDSLKTLWALDTPPLIKGLFYILCLFVLGFSVAFALTARNQGFGEDDLADSPAPILPLRGFSLLAALSLVATVIGQLLAIGTSDRLNLYFVSHSHYFNPVVTVLHVCSLLCAIPAALWFVRLLLKKKVSAAYGIAPTVYFLLLTVRVYFDTTYLLNNPRWSSRIITLVIALLFTVLEVRQTMPKKHLSVYRTAAVTAAIILTASALTDLTLTAMGVVNDGLEVSYTFVSLSLGIYAFVRVLQSISFVNEDAPEELVPEEPIPEETAPDVSVPDKTAEEAAAPAAVTETETVSEDAEETTDPTEAAKEPTSLAQEDVGEDEDEGEDEDLPDLTEEEVKRFLTEMTAFLAEKQGITQEDTAAWKKAGEQALYLLQNIMESEDRNARIFAIRNFLAKRGAAQ